MENKDIKIEMVTDLEVSIKGIFKVPCNLTSSQLVTLKENIEKDNKFIFRDVFPLKVPEFCNIELSKTEKINLLQEINKFSITI